MAKKQLSLIFILFSILVNLSIVQKSPVLAQQINLGILTPPPTYIPYNYTPAPNQPTAAAPIGENPLPNDDPNVENPLPNDDPSPTKTKENTGNPSSKIINFAADVRRACPPGIVNFSNKDCLLNIKTEASNIKDVIDKLYYSVQGYNYLQCVGFVNGAVLLSLKDNLYDCGNARDYANCPELKNYIFVENYTSVIKVDDIPVWDTGTYGHIAYVVKKYDNKNFQVAEANKEISGLVRTYNYTSDDPNLMGWLRKK